MSFTIDVHHHILPDVFWRATNDAHSPVGGISPAPWSKESTLSYMDDAGIDVAITSISTPGVHTGGIPLPVAFVGFQKCVGPGSSRGPLLFAAGHDVRAMSARCR